MSINVIPNIQAFLRDLANKNVFDVADAGAPVDGTSGTGAGLLGIGSMYTNTTNGAKYVNTGTKASPVWTIISSTVEPTSVIVASGTTTSGATTATSIAVSGVLETDIVAVTWRNAPQTTAHIVASPTTNAITVAYLAGAAAQTVGTAGTLQYTVFRAL